MASSIPTTSIHKIFSDAQEAATELDAQQEALIARSGGEFPNLYDPMVYFNRELSWLAFNDRVLNEALDPSNPLLERLKFIGIASSNLDEFFMIRVAGLRQQLALGAADLPPDGMTPEEALDRIAAIVGGMMKRMTDCFFGDVLPGLEQAGVFLHTMDTLDEKAAEWCRAYFTLDVFPVLTPLAIDPGHPFPHLLNRSLNLLMTIVDTVTREERIAVVQVPSIIQRLVKVPGPKREHHYVLLGDIIAAHANALFPGLEVKDWYRFRVTRNADFEIADDEASDLLKTIEEQVRRRRWGAVVRVEIEERMPKKLRKTLTKAMHLTQRDIYQVAGPLNLADFTEWVKLDRPALKDKPYSPRIVDPLCGEKDIFQAVAEQDIFLHHPYDSFSSVVEFIETAADDPDVLAIKQTLYRTNGDSAIVRALARAAMNGKQVTAFVELKARFDEENNIVWARALEQSGVHVVYGIIGLKTHCKLAIVVRKEKKALRTYVHMSTGNYNEATSRVYTDFGMLTARGDTGYEASALFNYLTGYSHQTEWNTIIVAPISMRQRLVGLIHREIETSTSKRPGRITAKLNALVDAQIIRALYRASQAGVRVDLLVRGICCLRPGLPGISDTITVRSIVGRFLEHSRVFVFENGGDPDVYIGSADWMPRNLNRRVELMAAVRDPRIKRYILETVLPLCMADNVKAWLLGPDGSYRRPDVAKGEALVSSQEQFLRMTEAAYRQRKRDEDDEAAAEEDSA